MLFYTQTYLVILLDKNLSMIMLLQHTLQNSVIYLYYFIHIPIHSLILYPFQ